jgi:NAD(P)-dependent dehydrogenase (short-subunit alcohol dehydrogenase family)/rhamnose utilization protein RhaD (predicted bifunctional aldolase and dehydrogenase)
MDKALSDLIKISNKVGGDVTLVQGGGGNTSVKSDDGEFMYIKASGTSLKDMDETKGWRRVNIARLERLMADEVLKDCDVDTREREVVGRLALSCQDDVTSGARPSVEAPLHAMLDKYVIHLHPSSVGAWVNAKDGKSIIEELEKKASINALWVPYCDPGYILSCKSGKLIDKYQEQHGCKPSVIMLDKHGVFVAADTTAGAMKLVEKVIEVCSQGLKTPKKAKIKVSGEQINDTKLAIRKAYFDACGQRELIMHFGDDEIASYCQCEQIKKMLSAGALTPDELVYSNGPAILVSKVDSEAIAKKICAAADKGGKVPAAFLVEGQGLFVAAAAKRAAVIRDIVASSLFIRFNALNKGGIRALTKGQQDFINNWEAEAFRKSQTGSDAGGRLKGRIAVVTGGGSGLGRSTAIGMAKEGAFVAVADIDESSADETVRLIAAETALEAITLKCNVADDKNVAQGYNKILDTWGGLDIVVNAAGVAPAFSLVDLPVDKWRFALEVNLTGYYLMSQAAARIMIKQGMGGSLVHLSSKSGLDASKNNTPYNATKAGELHMSRGWAIELGQFGIRSNCVCPGNVFEGSKIWNPEYIKVCAKKYGIKPEEVIPYYVSKSVLGIEVKGQDIADSVIFLASDEARVVTGQTMVVDAGQVFVR